MQRAVKTYPPQRVQSPTSDIARRSNSVRIKVERLHVITRCDFLPSLSVPRSLTGFRPANMTVRLSASIFVGFVLESLLYGVFIMIFIAATITQWERRRSAELRTGNKLVMGFSILLLGFISTVSVSRTPSSSAKPCIQVEIALDPQLLEML